MSKIIKRIVIIAGSFLIVFNAMAAEKFQFKGVSLGMASKQACGNEKITNEFEATISVLKESVPGLTEMSTEECSVPVSVFAKSIPSKPAHLLFRQDKLILYKLELKEISIGEMVQILDGLKQQYGAAKRTKKYDLVIDTWRQDGQTLELTRDGSDMEIFLKDDMGMKNFDAILKTNSDRIKNSDRKNIQNNMR